MKKEFRPEFLNRVDEIIVFHALTDTELKQIAGLMVSDVQKQMRNQEMALEITDAAKEIIVKEGFEPKFGARPLRRAVQKLIENPLSNQIIEGKFKPGDKIQADADGKKLSFTKIGETGFVKKEPAKAKAKEEPPKKKKSRKK
jgi:ATP-dependent Clp protease ATP-binding subunit ClpC